MRFFILAAGLTLTATVAGAQTPEWSMTKSCAVQGPEGADGISLGLNGQVASDKANYSVRLTNSKQAFAEAVQSISGAKLRVEPQGIEIADLRGSARPGQPSLIALQISDQTEFLNAIAKGNTLTIAATIGPDAKTYSIPLAGSASAVARFLYCIK